MRPDLEEVKRLGGSGNVVPVRKSVVADFLTPVSAFLKLREGRRYAFLLESVEGGEKLARYSFLGCDPFLVLSSGVDREMAVDPTVEHRHYPRAEAGKFMDDLRQTMDRYRSVTFPDLPPFTGGAVGYFGYDMVRLVEDIPDTGVDDLGMDDAVMMFFRTVLAFDHLRNQIHIVANLFLDESTSVEGLYEKAAADIAAIETILAGPLRAPVPAASADAVRVRSNFEREDYLAAVRKAREYIAAGDIFQVVLSQRFEVDLGSTPFDVYRALRMVNPSPYTYFLQMPEASIVGASPEMLVR